jgi:hypothetical protein
VYWVFLNLASGALCHGKTLRHRMVPQDDGDLLTAIAVHPPLSEGDALQARRHISEDRVACLMPMSVIDLLEVVDISEHQRKRMILTTGFADRRFQFGIKNASTKQLRKIVSLLQRTSFVNAVV